MDEHYESHDQHFELNEHDIEDFNLDWSHDVIMDGPGEEEEDGVNDYESDAQQEVRGPLVLEIGAFGRPEHEGLFFSDTWMDQESHVCIRNMVVPRSPFLVQSCGVTIYTWDGTTGAWYGSEAIRRERKDE